MGGARGIGRCHGLLQRQRIQGAALSGERLEVAEAEGDQGAARRRRRVEGDDGALVPPQDRAAALDAIGGEVV
jgi:hypothetical protein